MSICYICGHDGATKFDTHDRWLHENGCPAASYDEACKNAQREIDQTYDDAVMDRVQAILSNHPMPGVVRHSFTGNNPGTYVGNDDFERIVKYQQDECALLTKQATDLEKECEVRARLNTTLAKQVIELHKLSFDSYQHQARKFDVGAHDPRESQEVHLLGLVEEVGEVVSKVRKSKRDGTPLDRDLFGKELGDVLWQLTAVATDHGFDLDQLAEDNLKKLEDRRARGVLGGSGDVR